MTWLCLAACAVFGQGTVSFYNTPTSLISVGAVGQQNLITDPRDAYYFGLLIAPAGTAAVNQFTFSGLLAMNSGPGFPGRLLGGQNAPVPGWVPVTEMSFFVAGWSASLGHDWRQQWMDGVFSTSGYFGLSTIATGVSGGAGGGAPFSPLNLFGGPTGIQEGFNLFPVPEPSAVTLLGLGAIFGAWRARRACRARNSGYVH